MSETKKDLYELGELPKGWRAKGRRTAVYEDPALDSLPIFSVTGSRAAPQDP